MSVQFLSPPAFPKSLAEAHVLNLALWDENQRLRHRVSRLEAEVVRLKERQESLEEQRRRTSSNSSQPPSQDKPGMRPRPRRKAKSPRPRGAQPGHAGTTRELLPVSEVDVIQPCPPAAFCECGGRVAVVGGPLARHQEWEIPPLKPQVTEFQVFGGCCGDCGKFHRGAFPPGVGDTLLGPRAAAIVTALSGAFHLSTRLLTEVLSSLFGLPVAIGTISATEALVSEALAEPVHEAHEWVQRQHVVVMDETGLPQGNADKQNPADRKGWLWVAVTAMVTIFMATLNRGQETAKALLGPHFRGLVVSDRWVAYTWLDPYRRQLCWAHLKRDFTQIKERRGASGRIGAQLLAEEAKLFALWYRVRDGTPSPLKFSSFGQEVKPIHQAIHRLLAEAAAWPAHQHDQSARAKTARTCHQLLRLEPAMWLFTRQEGVEPTSNGAERAIRPYVLWRNASHGTESKRGSDFVARIMTVHATLKQQGRNLLDFLTDAITCHRQGLTPPSLLPTSPWTHARAQSLA